MAMGACRPAALGPDVPRDAHRGTIEFIQTLETEVTLPLTFAIWLNLNEIPAALTVVRLGVLPGAPGLPAVLPAAGRDI